MSTLCSRQIAATPKRYRPAVSRKSVRARRLGTEAVYRRHLAPPTPRAHRYGPARDTIRGVTGTLGLFSLVDLFQLLASARRSGRLTIDHPRGRARVYFEKGAADRSRPSPRSHGR